jgi:cysteine dioxygenase
MSKITSLNQLIKALDKSKIGDFGEVLKRVSFSDKKVEEIEELCIWNEKFYTRNLVNRTKNYELILLCWSENQSSPVHNHAGQHCWVQLLKGTCEEKLFLVNKKGELQLINSGISEKSTNAYIDDDIALHSIHNVGKGRMITLHLYSKPIDSCFVYDKKNGAKKTVDACYHANFPLAAKL